MAGTMAGVERPRSTVLEPPANRGPVRSPNPALDRPAAMIRPVSANTAREALQEFTVWLETERRASPNTIEAYQREIGSFIAFLVDHLGGEPHVSDLKGLSRHQHRRLARPSPQPGQPCSFVARPRRLQPARLSSSSSTAASTWPQRQGDDVRARLPHRLPRPLPEAIAPQTITIAGEGDGSDVAEWMLARDAAILSLRSMGRVFVCRKRWR